MLLFHEVCHSSNMYLLIDGLKLEKRILQEVESNVDKTNSPTGAEYGKNQRCMGRRFYALHANTTALNKHILVI